jgi:hypothetical protein
MLVDERIVDGVGKVRQLIEVVAKDLEDGKPIDRPNLAVALRGISELLSKASFKPADPSDLPTLQ